MWDADFYVKVDDDVHVNIGQCIMLLSEILEQIWTFDVYHIRLFISSGVLSSLLSRHQSKARTYIGCMKSGPVLAQK